MSHERRFSFETLSEHPVHHRGWGNNDRSEPHSFRPVSENVSPLSTTYPESVFPPISSSLSNASRYEYQSNGGYGLPGPHIPPFQEVRRVAEERASEGVPVKPSPSFLKVRRAVDHLPVPEMVQKPIRRKPLPVNPPSREGLYNRHGVQPPGSVAPDTRSRTEVYNRHDLQPTSPPVPENPRSRTVPNRHDLLSPPPIPDKRRSRTAPNNRDDLLHPGPTQPVVWGNSVEISPGYPQQSHSLEKIGSSLWFMISTNIFFLFIPLLFFGLEIGLGVNDNKPTNDRQHWDSIQNVMRVMGTFFPIAFAAVIGRAAVKFAGYRLEHGIMLGSLEQIMGSRTFGGTLGTQARLRSFNLTALGILALWVMSPIGSQAVLRLVSPKLATGTSQITMPYFNTDKESVFASSVTGSAPNAAQVQSSTTITSMFVAALLGPSDIKTRTTDLWGNVKIPYQSSLGPVVGGWASPNDSVVYSSLTGIPIGAVQVGSTEFTMESSYMELSCGNMGEMSTFNVLQPFDQDADNVTYSSSNGTYHGYNTSNTTFSSNTSTATWSLGMETFISPEFNKSLSLNSSSKSCQPGDHSYIASPCYLRGLTDSQPGTLLFQSLDLPFDPNSGPPTIRAAYCQAQQIYVESNITCDQSSTTRDCRVVAQRNSERSHAPSTITPLSFPEIFDAISLGLPRSFGATESGSKSDPSVFYLTNTSTQFIVNADGLASFTNVPDEVFAQRLGQLLNTYYALSQTNTLMAEGSPTTIPNNISTIGTITTSEEIYSVSWAWFAFLFIATMIMLLAAIASLIFDRLSLNPEILGYTSSIVRDSKYVSLPTQGGPLDGMELTKKNWNFLLKMGAIQKSGRWHLAVLDQDDAIQTRGSRVYA